MSKKIRRVFFDGGEVEASKVPPGETYFVSVKCKGHGYYASVIGYSKYKGTATSGSELAVRRAAEKLLNNNYPYSIKKVKCNVPLEERWIVTKETA